MISIFVIILVFVFKNSFSILLKDNLSQKNKDFIVNNFLIFKKIERLERELSNKNKQIEINQAIIEDQEVKIKKTKKTNNQIIKLKGGFNFYNFSQEKINLDNRKYKLKTIRTSNIKVAKHSKLLQLFILNQMVNFYIWYLQMENFIFQIKMNYSKIKMKFFSNQLKLIFTITL